MSSITNYPVHQRLLYFIREREATRARRELIGGPGPFSEDPIIGAHRFCNINREDDTVTKWVKENVRDRYAHLGPDYLVPQVFAARVFNEPSALAELLPVDPPDAARTIARLRKLRDQGAKTMRGAYMMPTHGDNDKWRGGSAGEYYLEAVVASFQVPWRFCHSLAGVAERMLQLHGVGEFVANQVVTDLRYTPHWAEAEDWSTFIMCGPGTRRGIDRYDATSAPRSPEEVKTLGTKRQEHYQARIADIREDLLPLVSDYVRESFRDPNNLSNTFCEFDKYERALWSAGQVRLRKYNA